MPAKKDLTNQKFNLLTVIKESNQRTANGSVLWECQCDCGNITYASSADLKSGHKKSCGCFQRKQAQKLGHNNLIDLTGQRFGNLIVLNKEKSEKMPNGSTKIYWKCLCDCGNQCIVLGQSLKNGNTQSCGCIKSFGEQKISKMLSAANISYEREKTFSNCPYRFDFFVDNNYIIEYDGCQHFQTSYWGGHEVTGAEAQKKDNEKNLWCKYHNLPIIRIPYTQYCYLTIKDLLLETSPFLIYKEEL